MRISFLCLASSLALVAMGCGGTGLPDLGPSGGPDLAGAHLQSGTYTISAATAVNDGCMLGAPSGTTQVVNVQSMLSIGNMYGASTTPAFNPPAYALGTGPYTTSSTATLTNSGIMVTLSDGCTFTRSDTTNVTFTGMNKLDIDWTHMESNPSATTCKDPANDPPAAGCTSEFKFTLSM